MSQANTLPYQLRPNKAVDRELFLSLLSRLSGVYHLENFRYVGLGGPYLEDFRLIHSRLGLTDMVSVEVDDNVRLRQEFNKPAPFIRCVQDSLENYVAATEFEKPAVVWFDFTDPQQITTQVECFASTMLQVPESSILRLTLNANPGSLGMPKAAEIQTPSDGKTKNVDDSRPTLNEWRLERFRRKMGSLTPTDATDHDMSKQAFGRVLLRAVRFAVDRELLQDRKRKVEWLLATHYADGQPMVTVTLLVLSSDAAVPDTLQSWPFYSQPDCPLVLDMPTLSTRERLALEANGALDDSLEFTLPSAGLGEGPYSSFRRFYRVFPHFSRVEF